MHTAVGGHDTVTSSHNYGAKIISAAGVIFAMLGECNKRVGEVPIFKYARYGARNRCLDGWMDRASSTVFCGIMMDFRCDEDLADKTSITEI